MTVFTTCMYYNGLSRPTVSFWTNFAIIQKICPIVWEDFYNSVLNMGSIRLTKSIVCKPIYCLHVAYRSLYIRLNAQKDGRPLKTACKLFRHAINQCITQIARQTTTSSNNACRGTVCHDVNKLKRRIVEKWRIFSTMDSMHWPTVFDWVCTSSNTL